MFELIKKMSYVSLGLAVMTKDKAEEMGKSLIMKGELKEKEGMEFVHELLKKSEEGKQEIEGQVTKFVTDAIDKINVFNYTDMGKLKKEIKELSVIVEKLENKAA
jgi:polyhydroxyalkanoate synthesis regulator phasin